MNIKQNLRQNRSFFDAWAGKYDSFFFQLWMRQFQKPVLKRIPAQPHLSILDLSSGTGELLRLLHARNPAAKLYGLDLSSHMLTRARKKLPKKVVLRQGDAHKLPFPNNSFDYVVSTEAFHHYYDQLKALREMKRVAKEEGTVIVVDVNFFLPLIHYWFPRLEPGSVKINSRQEMKNLFEKAGLEVIEQKRHFLFSVFTEAIKKRRGTQWYNKIWVK